METGSWYERAVVYRVDVPAFCDGDLDGVGDFDGLISRIPYLEGLGVTCVDLLAVDASQCNGFIRFQHAARNHGIRTLVQCGRHPRRCREEAGIWLKCGADGVVLPRAAGRCRVAPGGPSRRSTGNGEPEPRSFIRINGVAVPCRDEDDPIREIGVFRAQIVPVLVESLQRENAIPLLGLVIRLTLGIAGGRLRYRDEAQDMCDGPADAGAQNAEPLRLARLSEGLGPRLNLLHGLLFGLPGPPALVFGDEIGMDDVVRDPDGKWSPMRWRRGQDGDAFCVESQDRVPSSFLNRLRTLARLRSGSRALTFGDARPISYGAGPGVAILRECGKEVVLVVANLRAEPSVVECDLGSYRGFHLEDIIAGKVVSRVQDAWHRIEVAAHGWHWLRLVAP